MPCPWYAGSTVTGPMPAVSPRGCVKAEPTMSPPRVRAMDRHPLRTRGGRASESARLLRGHRRRMTMRREHIVEGMEQYRTDALSGRRPPGDECREAGGRISSGCRIADRAGRCCGERASPASDAWPGAPAGCGCRLAAVVKQARPELPRGKRKRGGLAATPPIVRHHSEPQGGALPVGPTEIQAGSCSQLIYEATCEAGFEKPGSHFGDPDLSMIHDKAGSVSRVSAAFVEPLH